MGSVGGMGFWIKLYFVAAKKHLPIKANSRVAYNKNLLIWMLQILKQNLLDLVISPSNFFDSIFPPEIIPYYKNKK